MWVFYLQVCLCTMCVPGIYRGRNRALHFLEVKLQTVVGLCSYMGIETQTQVVWKSSEVASALNY